MNQDPERHGLRPRLPDDPAYWQGLAARIVDTAAAILREHRRTEVWWEPLAHWIPRIAVAAAAAAVVAFVTMQAVPASAEPPPRTLDQMLSPGDPLAQAVMGGEAANVSALLLVESEGAR